MPTPAERAALLAAVLADPHDLGARVAYADWLLEYTDGADRTRGEFIALQLQTGEAIPPGTRLVLSRPEGLRAVWGISWLEHDLRGTSAEEQSKKLPTVMDSASIRLLTQTDGWKVAMFSWLNGWPDQLRLPWVAWMTWWRTLAAVWPLTEVRIEFPRGLPRPFWKPSDLRAELRPCKLSFDTIHWLPAEGGASLADGALFGLWFRSVWPRIDIRLDITEPAPIGGGFTQLGE